MVTRRRSTIGTLLGSLTLLTGCGGGGGDGGGPTGGNPVIAKATGNSGDGQGGTVGQPLADSFRVVVTQDGAAKPGASVNC